MTSLRGPSAISTPRFSTTTSLGCQRSRTSARTCSSGLSWARVQGVTSSVALAEATHKVMLAEVVHRHGVAYQGLIARLKRHPAWLDGLTSHHRVVATVRGLRLPVEAITLDLLARDAALSIRERLLTNDAISPGCHGASRGDRPRDQ